MKSGSITKQKASAVCRPLQTVLWLVGLTAFLTFGCVSASNRIGKVIATDKLDTYINSGKTYKIENGILYVNQGKKWIKVEDLRNPRFRNFIVETVDGKPVFTDTKTQTSYPAQTHFEDSFDNTDTFLDLFTPTGWSSFVLQSPRTPGKKKYAKLRKAIIEGKADFYDNRIDIVSDNTHSGRHAIRFYSAQPTGRRPTKTYIEKDNMFFTQGDDLWMSAWYFFEKGVASTIVDFETRWLKTAPGPRIFIRSDKFVTYELKFMDKPVVVQRSTPLPMKKWFELKIHLKLSSGEDGVIEIWQDDTKIIDAKGRTLPTSDSVLNIFEIGVTATDQETVLLLDDVVISNQEP